MITRRAVLIVLGFIFGPILIFSQQAIVTGIVAAALLGEQLNDAKRAAYTLFDELPNVSNRLIGTAANAMLIVAREMELSHTHLLDKAVGDLDEQTQRTVVALRDLQNSIDQVSEHSADTVDAALLDLESLIGQLMFGSNRTILKRIDGIDQLQRDHTGYRITITGTDFGSRDAKLVSLRIGGNEVLSEIRVNPVSRHSLEINIPNATLAPYFVERTPTSLRVNAEIDHGERVIAQAHEFYIVLWPRYAGTLRLKLYNERYGWTGIGEVSDSWTGPFNHCRRDCDDYDDDWPRRQSNHKFCFGPVHTPPEAGDRRFTGGVGIRLTIGSRGYDNAHAVSISSNKQCIEGRYDARTTANTYEIFAMAEQFIKFDGVDVEHRSVDLEYGKTVEIIAAHTVSEIQFDVSPPGFPDIAGVLRAGYGNRLFDVAVSDLGNRNILYIIILRDPDHSWGVD